MRTTVIKTGTVLTKNIRVLLADDHPLARNGIASFLVATNVYVLGEASDGLEALERVRLRRWSPPA